MPEANRRDFFIVAKYLIAAVGFVLAALSGILVLFVAFASISAGVWGIGHAGPLLLIGIPLLLLGAVCIRVAARK
jgi:hypothetical protein